MPVFASATTNQKNALRSGGWASEIRFAITPNTVVWQATVNQTISNSSFIQFAWDGNLQGAYTAAVVGMTFFITATTAAAELRRPLLRGRVSQAPTSTIFYCNESAINLTDGMILTVIANFEILQVDRSGILVDGFKAFEDLLPIVKNMQSFYYGESAVSSQFSFAPVGQAMTQGATIASYAWVIAGATYNTGSAATQDITVTVPYGHRWAYLTVTDSGGRALTYKFEILVCLRNDDTYMKLAHDNVTINGSIENGWNVSTTYFAGVTALLNRTRCAIVVFDVPKTGAGTLFNNVAFVGYFVEETTEITGDAVSSTLSQTNFELQSYAAIAGQLPVPSLPIRNTASPDEWGDINLPTTQRAVSYLLTRYSTLATLCAIDMLYTDSTWFAGEMDLEKGTLLDSVNRIGEEIQARLVFWPQGDATFEINANFESTAVRSSLPTLLASGALDAQDLFKYGLPIPYYKTVGQVVAGCATFYTNGTTPTVKLEAIAPATARQEGNEEPVILAQLLPANLTQANAVTAAKQRVGDLLEYLNPAQTIPQTLTDGYHVLTPSTRVWLNYDLSASDSTRGLAIPSTDRWILQSIALVWGIENGTWDVQALVRQETSGGLAQQAATISPNTINTSVPVLPILSDYGAFAPDASLNYESLSPDDLDLQPYSASDMAQYKPMTTEDAANEADNTPGSTCQIISPPVNFSSNTTRTTSAVTVNGEPYTIYVSGAARVEGITDILVNTSTAGSTGYASGINVTSGNTIITSASGTFGNPGGAITPDGQPGTNPSTIAPTINRLALVAKIGPAGAWFKIGDALTFTAGSSGELYFTVNDIPGQYGDNNGTLSVSVEGGDIKDGDAFYTGSPEGEWELYSGGRGLLVNGSPVSVPPAYNENHEYAFIYTGDGNVIPFTYYDTNYTDNANQILYIKVCGPGMGS